MIDDDPPPPRPYEEPVAGPAGYMLTRTMSLLFAPVLGFAAGGCVTIAIVAFSRTVADLTGGAATAPAVICVLAAALLWAGWRGVVQVRDGSLGVSPLELCLGGAMLPLFVALIVSIGTVVYALHQ